MNTITMDDLDHLAASHFDGYIVRKDLARSFKGRYPVPEYVAEFLLGRYCASTNDGEIQEGLNIVELQMRERTVRSGEEEELFKSRARRTWLCESHRHYHSPTRRSFRHISCHPAEPAA